MGDSEIDWLNVWLSFSTGGNPLPGGGGPSIQPVTAHSGNSDDDNSPTPVIAHPGNSDYQNSPTPPPTLNRRFRSGYP